MTFDENRENVFEKLNVENKLNENIELILSETKKENGRISVFHRNEFPTRRKIDRAAH